LDSRSTPAAILNFIFVQFIEEKYREKDKTEISKISQQFNEERRQKEVAHMTSNELHDSLLRSDEEKVKLSAIIFNQNDKIASK